MTDYRENEEQAAGAQENADMPNAEERAPAGDMENGVRREPLNGNEESGQLGPTVGIIIIIAVLLVGAAYFFKDELGIGKYFGTQDAPSAEEILSSPDPHTQELENQSSSDELDAIEQDLEGTNLENIDKELGNIEEDLNI